jgi:hypothetical protein
MHPAILLREGCRPNCKINPALPVVAAYETVGMVFPAGWRGFDFKQRALLYVYSGIRAAA